MIYFKKTSTMLILKISPLFCKKKLKIAGDMQKKAQKMKNLRFALFRLLLV